MMHPFRTLVCGALLVMSVPAALAQDIEVHAYRPAKIGVGSLLLRGVNRFREPQVYEVALNPAAVKQALPDPIEPRLQRAPESFMDRLGSVFRTRIFIRTVNHILRRVESATDLSTQEQLKDFLEVNETHTYAITGEGFAFAKTGPQFGKDLVSKHAIIAEDFLDVRYAGQFWREGESTLCFNSNSGTFLKKRKKSGLDPAPEHEAAAKIFAAVFSPALQVRHCREIAPWFGADEAIDQAQKAIAAADEADALAEDPTLEPKEAEKARRLALEARAEAGRTYDAAAAASDAEAIFQRDGTEESRRIFFELDLKAAEAADRVQKARKKIEKLIEPKESE